MKKSAFSCVLFVLLSVVMLHADEDVIYIAKKRSPLLSFKTDDFVMNVAAGVLIDYTFFDQDRNNLLQVGKQKDQFDLRAARAALYGNFNLWGEKIDYFVACGFSDYMTRGSKTLCTLFDAMLSYTLPGNYGVVSIGKMKEPWSYEMVGDSASLIQHERFLSPLFQSRNVGIRYNNTYLDKVGTVSIGFFNDWVEKHYGFENSSHQITGRITAVPYISDDNMDYLHLGFSARFNAGDNDTLRYRGKPESNVADFFLDTGSIEAKYAVEFGLEALWSYRGVSLLGEYLQSNVHSKSLKNPTFKGWYIAGGWVLTGESRVYDKNVGYARRIIPQKRYGALELIGRYGDVNLNDTMVHGGEMTKWMLGFNWWIGPYWKASASYGTVMLDRFDMHGKSDIALLRLQWFR